MAQRISMVSGVAQVQVFGSQKYAVRVQLDPDALAARGIGIDEVQQAHSAEQRQSSDRHALRQQAGLHCSSHRPVDRMRPPIGPMIVAYRNGNPVRLEELAQRDRQRRERQDRQLVQ